MNKPFIFGVAAGEVNFTDRKEETKRLLANFTHGINTIIISPRRWGKTSLVKKTARMIGAGDENVKVVYLDIFACRTEAEFYKVFATAVVKQTSSRLEEWIDNVKKFLTQLSPKISIGTDPLNDFSLSFEWNPKENPADEILQLPEKIALSKGFRIVVCIDEFQQISAFDDSITFQKRLRTVWQQQHQTSYCLFGSKQHLMNELFEKRSLPFYKFGDVMYLSKIGKADWVSYICRQFAASGKQISEALAGSICDLTDNHSSYVQQLSWLVWQHTEKVADEQSLNDGLDDLITQAGILFQHETENLSSYQLHFLQALVDGVTSEFSSKEVIDTYQLGSSANIQRIKAALMREELIDTEGKRVTLSDPIFGLWFRREMRIA
jgi:hypothetical protein